MPSCGVTIMTRQSNDPVKLRLRLSESLRWQLADAAKRSLRSMNSEIVYALEKSLDRPADEAVA